MIALRNISRNRVRNFLTLLGVAAGISVFVTSHAVSSGFRDQIFGVMRNLRIDITVQSRGAATPISSRVSFNDYEKLGRMNGVAHISSLALGTIKTPWYPYFVVAGVSGGDAISGKLNISEGRMLTPGRSEIMLGKLAAAELGYRVGNKIELREGEIFTIVGVYAFGSRILDGAAVLGIEDVQRLLKVGRAANVVFVGVKDGLRIDEMVNTIKRDFPELQAARSSEFVGQVRLFNALDLFVWVISLISLFTCGVVVMNTLIMAVSERTKEIGIMMAVGWSRFMVFRMIAGESLIICLLGGLAGNFISMLFLLFLNSQRLVGMGWIPTSIPPMVAAKSLALAAVLGPAAALYPALVASGRPPADALRYE